MNIIPVTLGAKPGIQRDGTLYVSNHFTSGQNTRFYHGWPTKILGWSDLLIGTDEIVGSLFGVPNSRSHDIYMGRPSSLSYFNLTNDGVVSNEVSRTPASGFTADPDNLWSFTSFTSAFAGSAQTYVVAQVSPQGRDNTNEERGGVFIGFSGDNTPLIPIVSTGVDSKLPPGNVQVSGGVVAAFGLIIVLDNHGNIFWCQGSEIDTATGAVEFTGTQNIGATKCVAALLYQGSLLVWTLDSLYRLIYVPAVGDVADYFQVSPLSNNISLWSANSIVEYQNNIYWVGKGQFYQFNGAIGRINNIMNNTWFFGSEGVNRSAKGRIYSFVDEQNDEIWHMYPRGEGVTQNNAAVIYYPTANVWNDTPVERSAAISMTTYDFRIMTSTKLYSTIAPGGQIINTYPVWQHEDGLDEVFNGVHTAIDAHFEYPIKDFFSQSPSAENNICMQSFRIEPDFVLTGNMTVQLVNQMYAQDERVFSEEYPFNGSTLYIDINPTQGRLVAVRFKSNEIGGYFESGRTLHGINRGASSA